MTGRLLERVRYKAGLAYATSPDEAAAVSARRILRARDGGRKRVREQTALWAVGTMAYWGVGVIDYVCRQDLTNIILCWTLMISWFAWIWAYGQEVRAALDPAFDWAEAYREEAEAIAAHRREDRKTCKRTEYKGWKGSR